MLLKEEIIQEALELLGVLELSGTADSAKVASCERSLNLLMKNLQAVGVRLWTIEETTKTFTASSEVTGSDAKIYTCIKSHTSATNNKPVTGANWTTYWAQRGITGGTWVTATAYSAIGEFTVAEDTIGIDSPFVRQGTTDVPIKRIGYAQYMEVSEKGQTGTPAYLVFDRQILPRVILSPQPDNVSDVLHYLRTRRLEDYDDSTVPDTWEKTISWLLAADVAGKFSLPLQKILYIENKAREMYKLAKANDRELTDEEMIKPCY